MQGSESFVCKLETYNAVKDYQRGGRCVRLLGIAKKEYELLDQSGSGSDGLTTFTIDIDLWAYFRCLLNLTYWRQVNSRLLSKYINEIEGDTEDIRDQWINIAITFTKSGANYLYESFSEKAPQFFSLDEISIASDQRTSQYLAFRQGNSSSNTLLSAFQASATRKSMAKAHAGFRFHSFHVGQGMCSLVHSDKVGVILDIGVGTPITRRLYLEGRIRNDLLNFVAPLSEVVLVISHPDADHWRLLGWDAQLRAKISTIFVPDGAASLAFNDKTIKSRLHAVADFDVQLDTESKLTVIRASPKHKDRNGDCLVTLFTRDRDSALMSGDYVYERMSVDARAEVRQLQKLRYSAIVVPHHGDLASSRQVPQCMLQSPAFFSAGSHKGYKHPTRESLEAHKLAGYRLIDDNKKCSIEAVQLL